MRTLWRVMGLGFLVAAFLMAPNQASADTVAGPTSYYGNPEVTTDADGTLIHVPDAPGGVYYRMNLDPAHAYRITINGQATGGNFVMRTVKDDASPAWQLAPNGVRVLRVSGSSTYELLLYRNTSDAPESYRLRGLEIEDCGASCGDDDELAAEIKSQTPDLAEAIRTGDDYAAALLALRWATPRITTAQSASALVETGSTTASALYYDYFRTGQGGVFCGGAADFFHRVLALLGIRSFRLDFGDPSFFTHSVVVVPVTRAGGGTDYRLLDPTFGAGYSLLPSGRAVSIPEMLELWREDAPGHIAPAYGDTSNRLVVDQPYADGGYARSRCGDGVNVSTMCNFESFEAGWSPIFARQGYEANLAGLLRLLGTTDLLNVSYLDVPDDFVAMQATFKDAYLNHKDDVHVAPVPLPPRSTAAPTIHGAAVVDGVLAATAGQWKTSAPILATRYRWERCDQAGQSCSPTGGATSTYSPTPQDRGHVLRVAVTTQNEYGVSAAATALTATVPLPSTVADPGPANSGSAPARSGSAPARSGSPPERSGNARAPLRWTRMPQISGRRRVGGRLRCAGARLSGAPQRRWYLWLSNGRPIRGATGPSYRVRSSDLRRGLQCRAIARRGVEQVTARSRTVRIR